MYSMPVLTLSLLLQLLLVVGGVQLKLNENFLCDINENTLLCDSLHYQFMPFLVERKFAHNRIDKLYLRCSSGNSSAASSSWTVANFVRENKKFTVMDYNSYITKRDLHELHIVDCPVEEQPLSQLVEILFNYNDQFRLKLLNVSGSSEHSSSSSSSSSSIEQLDHFLRKNEAAVRNLHVLEVANVQHTPSSSSSTAAIELVHLKHLRRLKLIRVTEGRAGSGSSKATRTSASINKSVRPLPATASGAGEDRGLVRLNSNLLELVLRNNSLMRSGPCNALLRNLSNLEQLDLSHNALTVDRVESCFQLDKDTDTEEYVDDAEDAEERAAKRPRMDKLKVLHLDHNRINFRKNKLFGVGSAASESLRHLEVLSLDHNEIDELTEATFAGLSSLLVLTLTGNRLIVIAEHSFRPLVALRQLALDTNRLTNVATLFASNKQQNQLLDLNLNGNQLTELPAGIESSLVRLKSLDLGSNEIATINGKQFLGLTDLLGLRLVDNQLTRVTKTTFHLLTALQIINLSANRINYIEQDAFVANQQLQIVRLDQNQLNMLPKNCFKPLSGLLWLNLSNNALNKFYMNELPNSVELLDLHANKIYEIKNMKGPDYLDNLRFLDLSHNHLPLLNEETIPNGLIEIDVEDNFITYIEINTFANKNRLTRVNLRNNLLSRLESKLFFHKINQNHDLELLLATNPFDCDCSLEWLMILQAAAPQNLQIVDLEEIACTSPIQRRRLTTTMTMTTTSGSGQGRLNSEPLRNSSELKANIRKLIEQSSTRIVEEHQQFLCKYENHCHTLCQCCDYEATCDCYMKCPTDCSCYYETTWQTNVVDCGHSNLTAVPTRIPVDATVLYLDGNDFHQRLIMSGEQGGQEVGSYRKHLFLGRNKLVVLYLNHSQIVTISNATLYGLAHLRELHLEHNRIAQLGEGNEFEHLPKLERLYLHDNRIEYIDKNTFRGLAKLQLLTLRRNSFALQEPFKFLLPSVLSHLLINGELADLHVGNEFNCEFNCNEMEEAFQLDEVSSPGEGNNDGRRNVTRHLLLPKFFKSKRANALKCSGGRSGAFVIRTFIDHCEFVKEANQQLRLVNKSAVQGAQNAAFREYLRRHFLWPGTEYMPAFAVAGTSMLFLMLCIILVTVFRQHIQLVVFSRWGVRLGAQARGANNGGNSGGAQLTVRRQSNGQLDLEPLCDAWVLCNERDYAYIESFVVDVMDQMGYYMQITSDWEQLASSVEVAQRTMLVISSGFLQIEWQNIAFRQALYSMLGKIESRGSIAQRLIVVVAVPTELLISDAQLLKLIKSATMVQLGEQRFWDKVRFAMPDVVMPIGGSSNNSRSPAGIPFGGHGNGGGANEASRNNWRRKLKRYADETGNEVEQQQRREVPPMLPPKPTTTTTTTADRSPDDTTTNEYDVMPIGVVGGGAGSERSGSTARGSCIENELSGEVEGEYQIDVGGGGSGDQQLGAPIGNLGNLHNQKLFSVGRNSARESPALVNGIDNEQQLQKIQSRYRQQPSSHRGKQQHYHPPNSSSGTSGGNSQQAYFV